MEVSRDQVFSGKGLSRGPVQASWGSTVVSLHARATVCLELEPHPRLSSGIGQSKANKAASATRLCKFAHASLEPCAVSIVVTFCLKTMPPIPVQAADRSTV